LISLELKELLGAIDVDVSLRQKRATLVLADDAPEPDIVSLNTKLTPHGYTLSLPGEAVCVRTPRLAFVHRFSQASLAVIAVMLLGWLVASPLLKLVPALQAGTSLIALFGFGVIASVSTCLASTGAFLLAYTAESRSRKKLLFIHAGRFTSFVVGGAVLGGLGGALPSDTRLYGAIAFLLGIGFFWVGLHLLDLAPSLASAGIRLPRGLQKTAGRVTKSKHGLAPFVVGAVTFVLPCGFTQTAQALALASGSPVTGALMMGAFALGSLPALLGITAFGGSRALKSRPLRLAAGALIFLFALGQIDGALTLFGSRFTLVGFGQRIVATITQATSVSVAQANEQVIQMTVAYGTYSPSQFTLRKNVPVRWEINGVDVYGCADSIIAPSIGINQPLVKGMNIIQFTPKKSGTIPFSCSMGMIRGSFTVVN
jgi:sulfite exporter TauE/SafE